MSASIVRSARSTAACFQPNIHKCTAVTGSTAVSTAVSAQQCTAVTGNAHMPRRRTTCGTTSDGRRRANARRPRPATSHRCCAVDPWSSEMTTTIPRPVQGHAGSLAAVGGIGQQLGQDALAQTTAAGAGAMRLSPVRNDIAGILRRMQPRCQRYRGSLPDSRERTETSSRVAPT